MLRSTLTTFSTLLLSATAASLPNEYRRGTSHASALRGLLLRQAWAEDSGHWDYALLLWYDELLHTVLAGGLSAASEFGWTEKALFDVAYASVRTGEALFLPDHFRHLHMSFIAFGRNVALTFVLCLAAGVTLSSLLGFTDMVEGDGTAAKGGEKGSSTEEDLGLQDPKARYAALCRRLRYPVGLMGPTMRLVANAQLWPSTVYLGGLPFPLDPL